TSDIQHLYFCLYVGAVIEFVFASFGYFFFQAEDGIRAFHVTGVQTCALPISRAARRGATTRCRGTTARCRRARRASAPATSYARSPSAYAGSHPASAAGPPRSRAS